MQTVFSATLKEIKVAGTGSVRVVLEAPPETAYRVLMCAPCVGTTVRVQVDGQQLTIDDAMPGAGQTTVDSATGAILEEACAAVNAGALGPGISAEVVPGGSITPLPWLEKIPTTDPSGNAADDVPFGITPEVAAALDAQTEGFAIDEEEPEPEPCTPELFPTEAEVLAGKMQRGVTAKLTRDGCEWVADAGGLCASGMTAEVAAADAALFYAKAGLVGGFKLAASEYDKAGRGTFTFVPVTA